MLVLTENAAVLIQTITTASELPAGAGLRIAATGAADGLSATTADTPDVTDEVIDQAGARVFLDEEAAVLLADKVLDAQLSDEGTVEFLIADQ